MGWRRVGVVIALVIETVVVIACWSDPGLSEVPCSFSNGGICRLLCVCRLGVMSEHW